MRVLGRLPELILWVTLSKRWSESLMSGRTWNFQSWRLSPVNSACTWSSTNELSSPAYVLTRKGNPFHFLRPHGVLEVVWGHRRPLPFLSGSTTIIVLVSLPRCAGPRSPRLLLAGVTTKSLSSVPLGLSFKCISRLPAVIW